MNLEELIKRTEQELKDCKKWLEKDKAWQKINKKRIEGQEKGVSDYEELLTKLKTLRSKKGKVK